MNEAKEVRLVFNPGKHGTVGLHAVITMSGDRAGALPQPTRRGYTFLGWYTVPDGAAGGDMGRNIFQSENPVAMLQAVRAVVHENASAKEAYDLFLSLK